MTPLFCLTKPPQEPRSALGMPVCVLAGVLPADVAGVVAATGTEATGVLGVGVGFGVMPPPRAASDARVPSAATGRARTVAT